MEVLHPRCAGLDVHRDSVVACVRLAEGGRVERHVETFATTTADLERLSAWLAGHGVTQVAMEATGVYWKPVWAVLCEGDFALVLANAHHVKAVPGRKTDVNDATWPADLLAHGLIRPSFVPPMTVQALRELTRTRKQLTREKASHVQRIDKLLQAANIKLGSVLSDHHGPERAGHPRRPRGRRGGPGTARRLGAPWSSRLSSAADRGPARPSGGPSAPPAWPASGPSRCDHGGDRADRRGGERAS